MGLKRTAKVVLNKLVPDIAIIFAPRVIAAGYRPVSGDTVTQVFDRGGVLRHLGWALEGGTWDKSPTKLTVTYVYLPAQTEIGFTWELWSEHKGEEERSYYSWVDQQLEDFRKFLHEWSQALEDS